MDGLGFVFLLVALVIGVWFCFLLPMSMARARGRSALGWLFISLVFSPLFAIVMLMVLGEARR